MHFHRREISQKGGSVDPRIRTRSIGFNSIVPKGGVAMPTNQRSLSEIVADVTERSEAAEVIAVDIDRHVLIILEHLLQLKQLDLMNVFMISDRQIKHLLELFDHLNKDPQMIAQELEAIRERLSQYTRRPAMAELPNIAIAEASMPSGSQDRSNARPTSPVAVVGPRIGLSQKGVALILFCLSRRESQALEFLKHKRTNKELVKSVVVDLKRIALYRVGLAVSGYVGLTKRAIAVVDGNRLTEDRVWSRLVGLFFKENYLDEETKDWLLDPTAELRPKPQPSAATPQAIDQMTVKLLSDLTTTEDVRALLEQIDTTLVAKLRAALNLIYLYRKSTTHFPEELKSVKESTRYACRTLHLQPRDEGSQGLWNLMLKVVFEAGIIDRKEYYLYVGRPIQLQAHRETCQLLGFAFRQEADPATSLHDACAEYWHDMPGWQAEVKFVYRLLGRVHTTELRSGVRAIEQAIGTDGARRGFLARLASEVVYGFSILRRYQDDELLLHYPDGAASDLKTAFAKAGIADDAYWARMLNTLVKWGVLLQTEADPYLKEIPAA